MTNEQLFTLYDSELILKNHNPRNLENERRLLDRFHQYLNGYPSSIELDKGFLSQYANWSPHLTMFRAWESTARDGIPSRWIIH